MKQTWEQGACSQTWSENNNRTDRGDRSLRPIV